ncbi:hypothetical protein CNO08_11005 [Lysobacter capsici]|nr:hypothetical protein CNO08_11005 [Lysobacter capsici]
MATVAIAPNAVARSSAIGRGDHGPPTRSNSTWPLRMSRMKGLPPSIATVSHSSFHAGKRSPLRPCQRYPACNDHSLCSGGMSTGLPPASRLSPIGPTDS